MAALLWCLSVVVILATATTAAVDGGGTMNRLNFKGQESSEGDVQLTKQMSSIPCSEDVTTEGNITSPNFPDNYPSGLICSIKLQHPECDQVRITFNSFDLPGRNPSCSNGHCCSQDFLEIITDGSTSGYVLCGTDIIPGKVFESSSSNNNNKMTLNFQTTTSNHSGWSADVDFLGCLTKVSDDKTLTKTIETRVIDPTPCTVGVSDSTVYWMSPNFTVGTYDNNQLCTLTLSSPVPFWVRIDLISFELEGSTPCPFDWVSFTRPFNNDLKFCGIQTGLQFALPSYSVGATFSSDGSFVFSGFNISLTPETSNCHQLIETGGPGSNGKIKPPRNNNNVWIEKGCEWWIRAPVGNQIRLKFINMALDCTTSGVIVNRFGDKSYPITSSEHYCGTTLPPIIFSFGNEMNVLFYSTTSLDKFKAKWRVI